MRLIDADKLEELCDIMADKCDGIGESVWHQFRTVVEWSPSVERRGKWIERDEECTWECSACGEPWTLIDGTPKQNGMNYCPNCGAKMEGGRR